MSDFIQVDDATYTVNEDGHHGCHRCGGVWFKTVVVFGKDGHTVATGITGAECSTCGTLLDSSPLCIVKDQT